VVCIYVCPTELLNNQKDPYTSLHSINYYFTSIGSKLAYQILDRNNKNEFLLAKEAVRYDSPLQSMALSPVDIFEVSNVISNLKNSSALGCDGISTNVLKKCKHILSEPISHLCNTSFETGTFPELFKKAIVIPIHKSGDKSLITNYRPISLLSVLSKVLEKLVNKRLTLYLESNNFLSINQFGFRQKKSSEDSILKLTNNITNYIDSGDKCIGVFLDLQKAFDTVSVPILLNRLENIGVRGVVLSWFTSYLTKRKQSVKIDKYTSHEQYCSFGVPQGSTLGPTLFLTYINQLCNLNLEGADITMYADDTAILFHDKTWEKTKLLAEKGLSKVADWLENSLLSLNTSKTTFLCFGKTKVSIPKNELILQIHTSSCVKLKPHNICDCPHLNKSKTVKYLGITIDDRLQWSPHIRILSNRIRKLIFVFKSLRLVADDKLLLQTFNALCQSIVTYGICSWGGACKTYMIDAERAQRAVLKVLFYLPFRYSTTLLYKRAQTLSIRKTFIYQCLRRFHRLDAMDKLITYNRDKRNKADRYRMPGARSAFARRNFSFLAPLLYNKINKFFVSKQCNNHEIKNKLIEWLKVFDYEATERLIRET
jgi:hypothetical protein